TTARVLIRSFSTEVAVPDISVCRACTNAPNLSAASWLSGVNSILVPKPNSPFPPLSPIPNRRMGAADRSFGREERDETMSVGSNSIRILAVDDHPIVRSGVAALLATQPDMSLVAEASNGREAIQQFRAHHPDITLMDLQMPEMSGLDAMIAIRDEFPEARIIVLTTYTGDV